MNLTRLTSAALVVLSLSACAELQNNPKRSLGTLLGAGLGALAGSQIGGGTGRESDRAIVPLRPGNAGGGKGPDFWHAFEGAEDR